MLEKFERLEDEIKRVIGSYEALKAESESFGEVIKAKDMEIASLKERLAEVEGEKNLVRERVDTLIDNLDGLIEAGA